ncbi:HNH endonuclease [Antarcticirhabdus aurantiaca]|uniref:HNH endonuclease n=1 Tax=Antarcticirhabdus aurantiaca TaxID=2606717 RepID=UPI00131D92A9|nr:HNH endonuclease signature motif containing protein [Antarcticirhabdus aurantiaca]
MPRTVKEWIGKTDDSMPGETVRLRIAARQGDACAECRRELSKVKSTACDHITPLADGGPNAESNLQILCGDCHGFKTGLENSRRAVERGQKAKHLKLAGKKRTTFRRPPKGTRYEQGPHGLRAVRPSA